MNLDLKATATQFLNDLLAAEFSLFIGRVKYDRDLVEISSRVPRNGHYQRSSAVEGLGRVIVKVPRDRCGKFKTKALEPYRWMEARLEENLVVLYLMEPSTRGLALISKRLTGTTVGHDKVLDCSARIVESVGAWRTRPITDSFKYLYPDGTNFSMRVDGPVEKVNVLVLIGVSADGVKQVLALQAGDKESSTNWR